MLYFYYFFSIIALSSKIRVIAATLDVVEESPCSHGSVMTVVFVLPEKIRVGKRRA